MVRLRHRYVILEIKTANDDSKSGSSSNNFRANHHLIEWILKAIRKLHGIQGVAVAKAGLLVKYISSTSLVYIRMRHSAYKIVTSSLPFVNNIDGKEVTVNTLHTAATIRHCNIFLRKHCRQELIEKYGSLKSDYQKNLFEIELKSTRIPTVT